jgi:hypothetical protein
MWNARPVLAVRDRASKENAKYSFPACSHEPEMMKIVRAPKSAFAAVAALSYAALTSQASTQEPGDAYCRDFRPGISYLEVQLPMALQPKRSRSLLDSQPDGSELRKLADADAFHFSAAAIKFATIASFIEQLALAVVAKDDPFMKSLRVMPMETSVKYAMGFGKAGTRLVEPSTDGLQKYDNVSLELVDSDGLGAYADSLKKITVQRGLVDRIVMNGINNVFGGVNGYKAHLSQILAMTDSPEGLSAGTPMTDVARVTHFNWKGSKGDSFAIGEVIENAYAAGDTNNPFYSLRTFAQQVVGQLVFIGAHEAGHVRNGHRSGETTSCIQFKKQERQADAYAAGVLVDYQFNITGDDSGNPSLNDWSSFFNFYHDSGLSLTDGTTGCEYDTPTDRMAYVKKAYELAWGDLMDITYSSADFTTPNPTASICNDGQRSWKKSFK